MWIDWITFAFLFGLAAFFLIDRYGVLSKAPRRYLSDSGEESAVIDVEYRMFLQKRFAGATAARQTPSGWTTFANESLFHAETQEGIQIEGVDAVSWVGA